MSNIKTCSCGARLVFLRQGDKARPVRIEQTRPGETYFDPMKGHVNHFVDCPDRKRYQRKGDDERPPIYDDRDLAAYREPRKPRTAYQPEEIPDGLPEAVLSLYLLLQQHELNRAEMRAIFTHQYGITGDPRHWDAATIARAREAIEATARSRDAFLAGCEAARRQFERISA